MPAGCARGLKVMLESGWGVSCLGWIVQITKLKRKSRTYRIDWYINHWDYSIFLHIYLLWENTLHDSDIDQLQYAARQPAFIYLLLHYFPSCSEKNEQEADFLLTSLGGVVFSECHWRKKNKTKLYWRS